MDDEKLTNASLEALQGSDQRKIMDIVDRLRRTGLSNVLQLPQLVVCGDQSSGKSSVLEAITEVPFPRRENLCTRFATELVLRREYHNSITTAITPDKNRPQPEQQRLREFSESINDFSELPDIIEKATNLMGLGNVADLDATDEAAARAFSRDVLRIEICGPSRPQLTLVDLPGLIHAANRSQSSQDVKLIHSLVEEYISNERTIILAVVSAKNDYSNQIILDKARKYDPDGDRTLGVITKPDLLRAGSENERTWIELAENKDIMFTLGWHILRNRVDGDLKSSFKERNQEEEVFFSQGSYASLERNMVGITAFRAKLSKILTEHLKKELPGLKKELDQKLKDTQQQLLQLGEGRATIVEQKEYLTKIALQVHDIFSSALNGHYERNFFGSIQRDKDIHGETNIRRLRAVIQHFNLGFAEQMRLFGRKYIIVNDNGEDLDEDEKVNDLNVCFGEGAAPSTLATPEKITQGQAVSWALEILSRSRGRELPGNFNPILISQLFWEQSSPWESLALAHVESVAGICREFVREVLEHVVSRDVHVRLQTVRIEAALDAALSNAKDELAKVIADKQRSTITYNHYYTTTVQKNRHKKQANAIRKIAEDSETSINGCQHYPPGKTLIDPAIFEQNIHGRTELDMDRFSAEEALACQSAYYKCELKYFVDVVAKQVIERHLIDALSRDIFSPLVVAGMTDAEIGYIAAEPADVTQKRKNLSSREKMLREGQDTFRWAIGGLRLKN